MAWTPFSVAGPAGTGIPDDSVSYGPAIAREVDLRLLGDLSGTRVLDLGCGAGRNSVALARTGARVIAVDESADQVALARTIVDAARVRVELHQAPLAELAFVRADTIDTAICIGALAWVADIGRVFRQLHRVMRPGHPVVISVPHPTFTLLDPGSYDPLHVRRSGFGSGPLHADDDRAGMFARSFSTLFTELARAGFRVDMLLEPEPTHQGGPHWSPAMDKVPATLIIRARKEGN